MECHEMIFAAQGDYPQIKEVVPNHYYADLMLDNMGGINSEMSAIALYIYNHFYEDDCYKEISEIFQKIAMVEMRHLNIFGTLAKKLGADPRLWSRNGNITCYWTPSYNDYETSFYQLMNNALKGELDAISKYESQLNLINEPTICACLERIIKDEQEHVKIFECIINKYFMGN